MLRTCPDCGSDDFLLPRLKPEDMHLLLQLSWPVRCACCQRSLTGPALPILSYLLKDSLASVARFRLRLRFRLKGKQNATAPETEDTAPSPAVEPADQKSDADSAAQNPPRTAPDWLWQVQKSQDRALIPVDLRSA